MLAEAEMNKLKDKFEAVDKEYLKFERIENKKSLRPDVHAFIMLDKLFPSMNSQDLISSAEYDIIYFDISEQDIENLTNEQILELVRCGIRYDEENECLYKFT